MKKKVLILLFVFSFIFVFSACDTGSTTDAVSEIVSTNADQGNSEASEISTEDEVSGAVLESSNVIDGIYYGDGIQFTIPDGYVLNQEKDGKIYFFAEEIMSMIYLSVEETERTIDDLTEDKIASFADEDTFVVSFDKITLAGADGVLLVYNSYLAEESEADISIDASVTVSGEKDENSNEFDESLKHYTIYQYTILHNSKIISLAFYTEEVDITETMNSVTDSIILS